MRLSKQPKAPQYQVIDASSKAHLYSLVALLVVTLGMIAMGVMLNRNLPAGSESQYVLSGSGKAVVSAANKRELSQRDKAIRNAADLVLDVERRQITPIQPNGTTPTNIIPGGGSPTVILLPPTPTSGLDIMAPPEVVLDTATDPGTTTDPGTNMDTGPTTTTASSFNIYSYPPGGHDNASSTHIDNNTRQHRLRRHYVRSRLGYYNPACIRRYERAYNLHVRHLGWFHDRHADRRYDVFHCYPELDQVQYQRKYGP
ncbi:uncharacterized protein ColSpa_09160 [Colletotrichum spaethianum]|uniref:Uncharacterized protein n=1 Tax=Colletotrichum spaethianum TaxID=700344 RepID=A0AA37PB66_9PEZI|nr:uncharacterized protein ColSpa_09160 [Colletotrichum spaethianum]GKT48979.1 hypothetical protein ColSpa_09160 [Colletotrichum spaethianum]